MEGGIIYRAKGSGRAPPPLASWAESGLQSIYSLVCGIIGLTIQDSCDGPGNGNTLSGTKGIPKLSKKNFLQLQKKILGMNNFEMSKRKNQ